jgi:cytochrome c2
MNNETMNNEQWRSVAPVRLTVYRLPFTAYCLLLTVYCLLLTGCITLFTDAEREFVIAGDPEQGREELLVYGCGACHHIPGVPGADATVGPPLENWANRYFIAGALANTPDDLIRWIRNPQDVEPGTAMPDLDVTEQDARNMAAYLYTLRE